MDVAIVAAARFPIAEPFAGGMEAHTHLLAESLAGRGHRVTVFAAGGAGSFVTRPMLPVHFTASAAARRDISCGPDDKLAEHHSYLDAMLELALGGHDIVHINAVHHLPFACASLVPGAVTATLHSPPTPWLESALAIGAHRRNPPRLASVSAHNAGAWGNAGIERIISNGIDLDVWRRGPGGRGAIWSGRIVPEKGLHVAIDACRRAGIHLDVMGPVHDRDYFEREVVPALDHGVTYLGHGDCRQLAANVGRAAVAVVTPLWDEPFGLVVVEALACGTPVAALARGSLPDLVDDDVGALAGDVDALAEAVLAATGRDRLRCRARAEALHSAERMVDEYEQWFQELIPT